MYCDVIKVSYSIKKRFRKFSVCMDCVLDVFNFQILSDWPQGLPRRLSPACGANGLIRFTYGIDWTMEIFRRQILFHTHAKSHPWLDQYEDTRINSLPLPLSSYLLLLSYSGLQNPQDFCVRLSTSLYLFKGLGPVNKAIPQQVNMTHSYHS